jgi:hypothetical protein
MAYVSQELKAKLAPTIKAVCKKYGIKATIAVRNHSTLCLNIKSGKIDFINNYANIVGADNSVWARKQGTIDVNPYHFDKHFSGNAKKFLSEVLTAMRQGNWDNSDIQTDYFDVGWYVDVNIGKWNQPYVCEA